jgi:hypothetical protein
MKKLLCLLLVCLVSGITYAQNDKRANGSVDNPSIKKSRKEEDKRTKEFDNHKRYSSVVNGHKVKTQKTQQQDKPAKQAKPEKNVPKDE